MSFVADPPPPDADARREFKYPYLACEIFCCELDAVFATLCEDECALFGRIVSFIDTDEPLHPTRAGYFGKVVGCVVARRAPETTRFFQNNPHVLRLLVRRIENLAVAEVLLRLVGADDPGISPMQGMLMSAIHGADNTGWLAETTLLDQLLDALGEAPETSDADGLFNSADTAQRRANAAEVLVGIARGAPSALADRLATADAMRELFAKGLERVSSNESAAMYGSRLDGSSGANDVDAASTTPPLPATAHSGAAASPLVNVVDVAVAVLDAKRAAGPAQAMQAFLAAETGEAPPEPRRAPPAAVAACARALPRLAAFLDLAGDASAQKTPWGEMTPPLGLKRVKVVDLVATLVSTRSESVAEEIVASGALPVCMSLFRRYPFNNFLHHHVERMCRDVLEWGQPSLLAHLFDREEAGGCDVVGLVTQAARAVETARAGPRAPGTSGTSPGWATRSPASPRARRDRRRRRRAAGDADADALETAPGRVPSRDDDDETLTLGEDTGEDPDGVSARRRAAASTYVREKLESDPRWSAYCEGELAARNALENTRAWRCGRPAGMDDPDDDDDGDDGDFDLGVGAGFSRDDAYDRYAGGGLEEEDEEGDDDDDERDIGFPGDDDGSRDEDEDGFDEDGAEEDGELANALGGAASIAAGLFQGDAGARLASLMRKNESRSVHEEGADANDEPTTGVPAFATAAEPFAGDAEEDDVVLAEEDEGDEGDDASSGAGASDADALGASEFGAVRYWGSSIDASLVPDDA